MNAQKSKKAEDYCVIKHLALLILFCLCLALSASGQDNFLTSAPAVSQAAGLSLSEEKAIRAIIGEAAGEEYQGMLALACGLRNRGTLKGVYGLNAKHIDKEPGWVWDLAKKAWKESEYNRIHAGGHWGSKICDKKWIKKMENSGFVKVYEYKNHVFYKEVR